MGTQGTEEGNRGEVVLDAGALIAFERGDQMLRAVVRQSPELELDLVIPASGLAQAWRGGPRSASLSRLIDGSLIDPLDEPRAKEVGERLGRRNASDIADAHVVCCAVERQAALVTSDSADMKALAEADERLTIVPV
jgi:hypothetical protein